MHRFTRRIAFGLVTAGALTGAFYAGVAYAADQRLDLADDSVENAIALLKAAQNPNAKNPKVPFGGHRAAAIKALETARKQIAKAKQFADKPPKPAGGGHGHGGKEKGKNKGH
jgi:hypothetical protein